MMATANRPASSTNPATWSSFDEAVQAVIDGAYQYIGFVFTSECGLVGIDIDQGFDADGCLSTLSLDCMTACKSYTERSKSGRGIHIIVKGTLPFKGKNNIDRGVEIYNCGRYFITTGNVMMWDGVKENQDGIDRVIETYFSNLIRKDNDKLNFNPAIYVPTYTVGKTVNISYATVAKGGRNLALASIAGQMHTNGFGKDSIFKQLLALNGSVIDPPLKIREISNITESITKYKRG